MQIVASEFMDEAALDVFGSDVSARNDPSLVDDRAGLLAAPDVFATETLVRG